MALRFPAPDLVARFRRDLAAVAGPVAGAETGAEAEAGGAVALAVSGGADSLALLLLASAALPGQVSAATVDHGLRAAAADEARLVASICAERGIAHRILTVTLERGGNLQARARRARYAALAGWMGEAGLGTLLTAHHADDQAETLLMRLLRGSGVGGLAAIRAVVTIEGIRVARPLLGWRRSVLGQLVRDAGLEPVDDPSNRDDLYDRARLRKAIAAAPWIDVEGLARSAAALAEADLALDHIAAEMAEARIEPADAGVVLAPGGVPDELLRRLVLRCLRLVVPEAAPRGDRLGALIDRLRAGRTATLAGVKCSGGATFRFTRAPPRRVARALEAG